MKRLIFFILITLFTICSFAYADSNIEVEVNKFQYNFLESNLNAQSELPQLKIKYDFKNFYVFGSYENLGIYCTGARTFDVNIPGLGIGHNYKINKFISIYADLGWYQPIMNRSHKSNEGPRYFMNYIVTGSSASEGLGTIEWEKYYVDKVTGAPGLTFGVKMNKEFKHLNIALNAGYRFLESTYNIYGCTKEYGIENPGHGWWTLRQNASYSGYFAGINISF